MMERTPVRKDSACSQVLFSNEDKVKGEDSSDEDKDSSGEDKDSSDEDKDSSDKDKVRDKDSCDEDKDSGACI